jgi:hypothetical protein
MKLITINSVGDYFVYGTSFTKNSAKEDDNNQINLNPTTWTNTKVLIKKGIATYPAEMADWNSVKALVAAHVITISNYADGNAETNDVAAVNAAKKAEKEEAEQNAEIERRKAKKKIISNLGDSLLEKAVNENVEKN